jgi:hypothetical protein
MPGIRDEALRDSEKDGPEMVASDEQLMVAFSRGSTDSFGELFSRYKQPMFGFFRRRLRDPAEVECPARFVPVEMRQTGTRGVGNGTRQEAYGGADRESAATG